MKNLKLGLFALATALVLTPVALADPIVGTLGIVGGDVQWSSTVLTFSDIYAIAGQATGSYATVLGIKPATTATIIDSSELVYSTPDELIFTVGGNKATLTITGPVYVSRNTDEFLDISGTGTLTLIGYDPTPANFSLDSVDSSHDYGTAGSSTFGIDVTTYITPEPTSLLLFGSGMLGLAGMLRRKMAKRQI